MRTPLQEQLLKAGLAKKHKVANAVREQNRQRHGRAAPTPDAESIDTQKLQEQRAERDRALSAERNALAHTAELRAQVRQIVENHKVARDGEIAYSFNDDGAIRNMLVDESLRAQLAKGALVIVRHDQGYELVPRAVADKIFSRDPSMIVLDHGRADGTEAVDDNDDEYYKRFQVPDDLVW